MCNTNKTSVLRPRPVHYCDNFVVVDYTARKICQDNYDWCWCYADEWERECSYDNYDPELEVLELDYYLKHFC